MSEFSVYEQPLNEKVRMFLRLELLLHLYAVSSDKCSPREHRYALAHLLEVFEITQRADIKNELAKELDRYCSLLANYTHHAHVDQQRLSSIRSRVTTTIRELNAYVGQPGQALRDHEFLNALRTRSPGASGPSAFDMPIFHRWLDSPVERQAQDLKTWYASFSVLHDAVRIYLKILRDSTQLATLTATEGIYNTSLKQDSAVKLVRVQTSRKLDLYPEISGGRHRLSVRFMRADDYAKRAKQTTENIEFQLACCAF